jgi:hypothetical protein
MAEATITSDPAHTGSWEAGWMDVQNKILLLRRDNDLLTRSNAILIRQLASSQASAIVREDTLKILSNLSREVIDNQREIIFKHSEEEKKLLALIMAIKELLCDVLCNMEPYIEKRVKGDPLPHTKYANVLDREQYKRVQAMYITLCFYGK